MKIKNSAIDVIFWGYLLEMSKLRPNREQAPGAVKPALNTYRLPACLLVHRALLCSQDASPLAEVKNYLERGTERHRTRILLVFR